MLPWNGPETRSARPLRRLAAAAALLLAAACAPRATGVPTGPGAPPEPAAPAPPATPSRPETPLSPNLPRREPTVRVGLMVDTSAVEISSPGGLELTDGTGGRVARVAAGEAVRVSAAAGGQLRYTVGAEGSARSAPVLVARPSGDAPVLIGGKAYRGSALVRASGPGRLTAVNQVEMEEYLLGVVPREIGRVGEERYEAAKAQAVAARTYAVKYMGRRQALGFDVFATVQDQVYGGVEAEYDLVTRAVRETEGEILVYGGEPIEAFYHSTCAGQTAAIHEVWNQGPVPYLVSVVDVNPRTGQAYDVKSSRFRWTERWPVAQMEQILNRTLADSLPAGVRSIGQLRDMRVLERTESGRVRRMRISTSAGDFVVGGDRVRWILLTPRGPILNSSKFDVEIVRDAAGKPVEVVATGGGWGHGIGMCQVGAMGRAEAGQGYAEILRAYYPRTELVELY